MADAVQIKKIVDQVLCGLQKVSSFAASINPIFSVVSPLIGVARKGLKEDGNPLDKDFQEIHTKLESIYQKNQECLIKIPLYEVNETYNKYGQYIKHQYDAFNTVVAQVKKDPDNTKGYIDEFMDSYEKRELDQGLLVYYDGVMGKKRLFGRPLLKVYLDNCDGNHKILEHHCLYIAHLFHIGIMALMAYTAVKYDKDEVQEEQTKWAGRALDIQEKMQEVISQCKQTK